MCVLKGFGSFGHSSRDPPEPNQAATHHGISFHGVDIQNVSSNHRKAYLDTEWTIFDDPEVRMVRISCPLFFKTSKIYSGFINHALGDCDDV